MDDVAGGLPGVVRAVAPLLGSELPGADPDGRHPDPVHLDVAHVGEVRSRASRSPTRASRWPTRAAAMLEVTMPETVTSRRRRLRLRWIAMALLVAATIAACSAAPTGTEVRSATPRAPVDRSTTAATVLANSQLATDLYKQFARDHGNFAFSPYAVSIGLAQVGAGAAGQTAARVGRGAARGRGPPPRLGAQHARPADRQPRWRSPERRAPGPRLDPDPDRPVGPEGHAREGAVPRRAGPMVRNGHEAGRLQVRPRLGPVGHEHLGQRPDVGPGRRPRGCRPGRPGHPARADHRRRDRRTVGSALRRDPHPSGELHPARRPHRGRHEHGRHRRDRPALCEGRRVAVGDDPVPRPPVGHGADRAGSGPLRARSRRSSTDRRCNRSSTTCG